MSYTLYQPICITIHTNHAEPSYVPIEEDIVFTSKLRAEEWTNAYIKRKHYSGEIGLLLPNTKEVTYFPREIAYKVAEIKLLGDLAEIVESIPFP